MTTTDMRTARDVVSFLKAQHQEIKALFDQVQKSTGKAKEQSFYELRRLLAVHETAEEEVVHPQARSTLADGKDVVDARLEEENKAKKTLARLEKLDVGSGEFAQLFEQLHRDVVAHAEAEEREEFADLEASLDDEKLATMQRAVEFAQKTAPTRPHPGVESAVANVMAGPFASMLDRARDALQGKG
jgi:hemerythrin superfamily protein